MDWVLFLLMGVVWAGILVACFPSAWPAWVHERVDGHLTVSYDDVIRVEINHGGQTVQELTEPLSSHLLDAFNTAHFLKRIDLPFSDATHLRIILTKERYICVKQAKSVDDIYIFRFDKGRLKRGYWAREPELYRFLTHQLWRTGAQHKPRPRNRRPSHLRVVR